MIRCRSALLQGNARSTTVTRYRKGSLTIKSVISPIVEIKFLVKNFAFDFALMHIKEKCFQPSRNKVDFMLAYQPVCYFGFKRVGPRFGKVL